MSSVDKLGPQPQLVDDVEGTLRHYFKHNLHDEEAKQTFLKASLKFLYRKLEKRLENFSSGSNGNVSIKTQSDSPHRLPSLKYQDKVKHWVSKCLHAGRISHSRSTSVAEFKEQFHSEGQGISHTKLSDIDAITHSSENPKVCRVFTYSQTCDRTESFTTQTSVTSSEDNVLIIVASAQGEIVHKGENRVSTGQSTVEPHLCSRSSYGFHSQHSVKNDGKDITSVDTLMDRCLGNEKNNGKKQESVKADKQFKSITQSLEVTGEDSIAVKEASNSGLLKWDDLIVPGCEYARTHKYPSQGEAEYLDSAKDEVTLIEAAPSNSAVANARDEVITSDASSTKEVKKTRSRSSRIHAAILHLLGSKNAEKKPEIRPGRHCSQECMSVGVNSNIFKEEDMIKSTKHMPQQQNAEQNARQHHDSTITLKSIGEGELLQSGSSSCSKMQKLAKLKVCKMPVVPACQSCEQIQYLSSRRATRDVATYTEELMTGYCQCKRCVHGFKRTVPCQSESILSEMHYKLHNRDEIEELSTIILYALLKDLKKCNRHSSLKVNSKCKRRLSRFTDIRGYGAASWPLNIRRHRELQKRTEVVYEETPGLLRQSSKFSAWYGDEKSSDSEDEDYRPGRHRLLPEQLADLMYLMSRKKLRSRVKSSLMIRSSHASQHIPSSEA